MTKNESVLYCGSRMKINSKVIVTTILILAVPLTVGFALHEQNTQQNAAIPLIRCNPNKGIKCPQGMVCKLINPLLSGVGGFCTLPLPSLSPTTSLPQLSCKDCRAAGANSFCVNITNKMAYCRIVRNKNIWNGSNDQDKTLCLRCAQPVPSVTCIPRPPCLNAVPRCEIAEPVGGWCPPVPTEVISVTPSIPPGCKPFPCTNACSKNNPNCCKLNYICPSVSPVISPSQSQEPSQTN